VRIAFDGDAVLFPTKPNRFSSAQGLDAFQAHERDKARQALVRRALQTFARCAASACNKNGTPSHAHSHRAWSPPAAPPPTNAPFAPLMDWDIEVDEAMFLGGLDKGRVFARV
jgi:5'-nucleotidase